MDGTRSAPTPPADSPGYPFGDLLALARRSWVRQLSDRAAAEGFADFRRSDTILLRILASRAEPIGRIGEGLGITRQAARKLADGLVARGHATLAVDPDDGRRTLVELTDRGRSYHRTLAAAAEALNGRVRGLPASDMRAADAVLRSVLTEDDRRLADAVVPRPSGRRGGR